MRTVSISRDRRQLRSDDFDKGALALLPAAQRQLLVQWLKAKSQKPKWDTLIKIAVDQGGQELLDAAKVLAESLAQCGAAILEQRFEQFAFRSKESRTNSSIIKVQYNNGPKHDIIAVMLNLFGVKTGPVT